MGRPINADAAETRRNILVAGIRAFGRRGIDGTTVRQVADEVGITFAAVHHHFGTKEQLFEACLDQAFAELAGIGGDVARAVAEAPAGKQIAAGVRCAVRAARENPDRSRFLLRAFVFEDSPAVRERVAASQRALLDRAECLLPEAPVFGRRVPLVGLGILITRFAVSPKEERALFALEVDAPDEAVEAYLVRVAEETLCATDHRE